MYRHIQIPAQGTPITVNADNSLNVPFDPIIPFIEGDGTGVDITPVMQKVVNAAVHKAYKGQRTIHWMEVFAGDKAVALYGPDVYLPDETLSLCGLHQRPIEPTCQWWRSVFECGTSPRT